MWLEMLLPGWRPAAKVGFRLTAMIALMALGTWTRYVAATPHRDTAVHKKHEEMVLGAV